MLESVLNFMVVITLTRNGCIYQVLHCLKHLQGSMCKGGSLAYHTLLQGWGPCLYLPAVGPGNFWSACQMLTETGGRGEGFRYVWFPPAAAFGM